MKIKYGFLMLWLGTAQAATVVIHNQNIGLRGFNDPTPVEPVDGNPETTLGAQRLFIFKKAAQDWADRIQGDDVIHIDAKMDVLDCSAYEGILGSAGPINVFRDFSYQVKPDTWYAAALANHLAGEDIYPQTSEIQAVFNRDVDDNPDCLKGYHWYYGLGTAPSQSISFYTTVYHEIAHGLGYMSFVNPYNGQELEGYADIFEYFIEDHEQQKIWVDMSASERAASAKNTGQVHWIGEAVKKRSAYIQAGKVGDHVQLYAPEQVALGTSIAHWDTTVYPNELMEPFYNERSIDIMTSAALSDLGWQIKLSSLSDIPSPAPNLYCSEQPETLIDNGQIQSTLQIDTEPEQDPQGLALWLKINHPRVEDLKITISHEGQSVLLIDPEADNQQCLSADIDLTLWDGAEQSVIGLCSIYAPAISGLARPIEALKSFQSLQGEWTLSIQDRKAGQTGELEQWCLLPNSHNQCDGDVVELNEQTIAESLVCNAGIFRAKNTQIEAPNRLKIYYSGSVRLHSGFRVKSQAQLQIQYQK